jgi:hypothetical protein
MRLAVPTSARRSCEPDALADVASHDAGAQIGPSEGVAARSTPTAGPAWACAVEAGAHR